MQSVLTLVIALSGSYEKILNYVVSIDFIFFGLTGASLFVFRRRDPDGGGISRARASVDDGDVCGQLLAGGGEYDLPVSGEYGARPGDSGAGRAGVWVLGEEEWIALSS